MVYPRTILEICLRARNKKEYITKILVEEGKSLINIVSLQHVKNVGMRNELSNMLSIHLDS